MSKPEIDSEGTLTYDVWWRPKGGMMYRRDALNHDHPEQTYNYLKAHGIRPESYGIHNPLIERIIQEYAKVTREDLILENIRLRKDLEAAYKAGF